ncbi:MAG TPA: hypothetical protein VF017_11830 [Thermoanaerobaculia bacterium]|nr:hypothetical protein [Thermoanaerobaculia bacterium]
MTGKQIGSTFSLILLLGTVPALAHTTTRNLTSAEVPSACEARGRVALEMAAVGVRMTPEQMSTCLSNISSPPAGSGNWPIELYTAQVINHDQPTSVLTPWLRGQNGWSLNGTENASIVYHAWNWAAALAVHKHAMDHPGTAYDALRNDSKQYLKATLARMALAATPSRPSQIRFRVNSAEVTRNYIDASGYTGLFVHHPADRSSSDPISYTNPDPNMGGWVEGTANHSLLTWCLGVTNRKYNNYLGNWVTKLMSTLYGGRAYTTNLPEGACGATAAEITNLLNFVNGPTPARAALILPHLTPYPNRTGREFRYRYYLNGARVNLLNQSSNSNKGAVNLVTYDGVSLSWWVAPAKFKPVGSASSSCAFWGPDPVPPVLPIVTCSSTDGFSAIYDMTARYGQAFMEIVHNSSGLYVLTY